LSLSWNKNLRNRLIVGFTGGPLILACAWLGGWFFFGFILVLLIVSLHEMHRIGEHLGFVKHDIIGYIFSTAFLVGVYSYSALHLDLSASHVYFIVIAYITIILIAAVISNRDNQLLEVSYRCLTTLYLSFFLGSLLLLRESPYNSEYTTGGKYTVTVFLSIFILDTAAYFAGKIFGSHPLFPRISPKKTVEGAIGGLIGAASTLVIVKYVFFNELSLVHALVIGTIIGVAGQIGDVLESFIKRKAGVKDSSSILPGHGGVLDRFDSLIFASPFVYFYVWFVIYAV